MAGVSRDVHLVHLLVDHLGAQLHQLVDHAVDQLLIAGNRGCGDDDEIVRGDGHLAVVAHRHAGERGHRLALAAGGDNDQLVGAVAVDLVDLDEDAVGHLEVAQLGRLGHHIEHTAPGKRHLALVLHRIVHDLLHAVDVGGETCDDDAAVLRALEQVGEALPHLALAHGHAGLHRVGRIHQQRQHAAVAQLAKARQVGDLALDRGGVDLEVARHDDNAGGGVDRQGQRVWNRVVDVDELHGHTAHLDGVARLHHIQLDAAEQPVLLELALDQPQREARGIDRGVDALEQKRQPADVILVAVGEHDSAQLFAVLLHIAEVGDDQIHAGHLLIREGQTAIDDEHIAAALDHGHIFADLMQAAQRDDAHRCLALRRCGLAAALSGRFRGRRDDRCDGLGRLHGGDGGRGRLFCSGALPPGFCWGCGRFRLG